MSCPVVGKDADFDPDDTDIIDQYVAHCEEPVLYKALSFSFGLFETNRMKTRLFFQVRHPRREVGAAAVRLRIRRRGREAGGRGRQLAVLRRIRESGPAAEWERGAYGFGFRFQWGS